MEKKNAFLDQDLFNLYGLPKSHGFDDVLASNDSNNDRNEGDDEDAIDEESFRQLVDDFLVRPTDWAQTHPSANGVLKCGSDKYYADLVSTLKCMLYMYAPTTEFPDGALSEIAFVLSAYLEDIVSGIGVWDAIRNVHHSRYGCWLPFYDCDHEEYLTDNVNIEDLKFLVWQALCRCGQKERIIFSPFSQVVDIIAGSVYNTLVEEFETAPETTRVVGHIKSIFRKGDFFQIRSLEEWLVFSNPLTKHLDLYPYLHEQAQIASNGHDNLSLDKTFYSLHCIMTCGRHIGPEGLLASDYLAVMSADKGFGELADKLRGQKSVPTDSFRMIETGKHMVTLEDATGTIYHVDKKSFSPGIDYKSAKGFVSAFVKFGEHWQANGMAIVLTSDPFEKERYSSNFTTGAKGLEMAAQIAERHKGRRIFYCKDIDEMSSLIGVPYKGADNADISPDQNFLVMLSKTDGIIILPGYAPAVKDKLNPFYDKTCAGPLGLKLIASGLIPDDIAQILQEKKMLPDATLTCSQGKRFGKRTMQENLRYIANFYRDRIHS